MRTTWLPMLLTLALSLGATSAHAYADEEVAESAALEDAAMQIDAAIDRVLAVLETRLPNMLDEVMAETASRVVTLDGFDDGESLHSLTVGGVTYGPVTAGATEQATLAALSVLVTAGNAEWAATLEGEDSAARLRIQAGPTVSAASGTAIAAQSYLQQLGALADPSDFRRMTEEVPPVQYPSVQVELEGTVDVEEYFTPHEDLHHPLAIHVVGWMADNDTVADRIGNRYAEAVRRVLRRYGRGGGVIDKVDVENGEVVQWGEGASGRSATVRATAHKWGADAS